MFYSLTFINYSFISKAFLSHIILVFRLKEIITAITILSTKQPLLLSSKKNNNKPSPHNISPSLSLITSYDDD